MGGGWSISQRSSMGYVALAKKGFKNAVKKTMLAHLHHHHHRPLPEPAERTYTPTTKTPTTTTKGDKAQRLRWWPGQQRKPCKTCMKMRRKMRRKIRRKMRRKMRRKVCFLMFCLIWPPAPGCRKCTRRRNLVRNPATESCQLSCSFSCALMVRRKIACHVHPGNAPPHSTSARCTPHSASNTCSGSFVSTALWGAHP